MSNPSHTAKDRIDSCLRDLPGGRRLTVWAAIALLGIILLAGGCNSEVSSRPLSVAGSTSVQPFAEKLAEVYIHQDPKCRVDVQGGGSSAGIYAAEHGAADLGTSSRELLGQ